MRPLSRVLTNAKRCTACFSNKSPPWPLAVAKRSCTHSVLRATVSTRRRAREDGGDHEHGFSYPPNVYLRCFPVRSHEVVEPPQSPEAFHRLLCRKVSSATRRVQLASLYVGTATPRAKPPSPASHAPSETTHADPGREERELLESLRGAASAGVPVQILLDANRALRPVPALSFAATLGQQGEHAASTTTSARACFQALAPFRLNVPNSDEGADRGQSATTTPGSGVYLLSVLPPLLQRVLPNPLNEIAGVFHIKVYLVDDEVILSGANLSREYFTTRIDRYLCLRQPDLVEFYSQLVHRLCQHGAVRYNPLLDGDADAESLVNESPTEVHARRRMLLRSLEELFTTTEAQPVECKQNSDVVAYAIPTFQAPQRYFPPSVALSFPDHEQTLRNLLESARLGTGEGAMKRPRRGLTTRIATAYLNPTADFLELLARCSSSTWFLTAGPVSHGFAPKQPQQHQLDERKRARNVEDRSHGWAIPNVFRYAAQRAVKRLDRLQLKNRENSFAPTIASAQVGYYQRPGWTFHAKGMWLSFDENGGADRGNGLGGSQSTKREDAMSEMRSTNSGSPLTSLSMPSSSRLLAVCTGSGNFGARSARRDMESNLILIFPQSSSRTPLVRRHVEEWNRLCEHATSTELPETPDPPRWIRFVFPLVFPLIRSFF